jgi:signal transduction histidine kinase
MSLNSLDSLASLIMRERSALLVRWRAQVRELPSAQNLDNPTLNDHIPALLDELADALKSRSEETIPEALLEGSPPAHGLQRLQEGFDLAEVVAEYNILRGCLHDLADAHGLNLQGRPFHIVNRVLDHAIGLAVEAFASQRAAEVQKRRAEYLAFVAHDLRTPLSAISLASKVLELELPDGQKSGRTTQMFKTLRRNVEHLAALVGKVIEENSHLETESGVKLERRDLDLWPLVESQLRDLKPVADASNTKICNVVPEDLVVYADAGLLRRVIQNLTTNAIRYAPGGEVTLGARDIPAEGIVECWVSDTGVGIPEDRLARVFEPFETDPAPQGGLGLGLSIVKSFIEAHGGKASAESKQGIGSTFRFTLPKKA